MITEIISVKDSVEKILEECPKTRGDDKELIFEYFKKYLMADEFKQHEKEFIRGAIYLFLRNMPPMESISRARRMVQKLRPELQAREEIVITRQQEEIFVRDFFIGNGC
jgi:hypothetical protein